jgi:hypothetical protein
MVVLAWLATFLFVGIVMNVEIIRQDTTYIRQQVQWEEEPIDPFSIIRITTNTDTIHIVCEPYDTTRLKQMLAPKECSLDSSRFLTIEYVDE